MYNSVIVVVSWWMESIIFAFPKYLGWLVDLLMRFCWRGPVDQDRRLIDLPILFKEVETTTPPTLTAESMNLPW
jgi:hypothetical protein